MLMAQSASHSFLDLFYMEAGQIFKSRIQNNTPNEDIWGVFAMDFRRRRGLRYFLKVLWIQWLLSQHKFFLWFLQIWRLAHTDHGMGLKVWSSPKAQLLCISYNLSAASSNPSPRAQVLHGINQCRNGKYDTVWFIEQPMQFALKFTLDGVWLTPVLGSFLNILTLWVWLIISSC